MLFNFVKGGGLKKITFALMSLRKWLKKSFLGGILRFFPLALLASGADAAVLWGIKSFMGILSGEAALSLYAWIALMVGLTLVRLLFLYLKTKTSERWLYNTSGRVVAWFLHGLRNLSPRVFHTPEGERQVEAAYESTQVLQNNGSVLFQGVQAILQLVVFLPVLLYISWPLAVFLFVVIVPLVGVLQRKLHKLGPAEESLLRERSDFRGDLNLARRLFRQWSSSNERKAVSENLLEGVRNLRDNGLETSVKKNSLSLVTEAVSVLAMVLVLGFCAILIQNHWMDGTGLVLFCSAVLLSYKPVKECSKVMPQFRSVMSALNVLEAFENLPRKSAQSSVQPAQSATEIQNKSFKYEGSDKPVFDNFSVSWSREKPVLVRGENGVGKSTFLRLLAGLEQWDDGSRVGSLSGTCNNVFFVAQDLELPPRRLLLQLLETVSAASSTKASSSSSLAESPVLTFREFANVGPLLNKAGLSGGERAKVALLWALASSSRTILLDEPFASIALSDREPLLKAFLDAAAALGKWTIIVSHDVLSEELESRFNVVRFGSKSAYVGGGSYE